ncbi:hypothetical protein [[Mycobacterium] nativiensis]|uniref:Uncharacterized protein n=1 Tax=[Mycobacterium] nativiensis TaxID=2855503 RepID=A0ABU5Y3X9_9MYCO|nr:hypothetical protein [Mycolicibacter sp. MYC340]MEB3033650.1 hypothetical protein [Mycolicibacter sp. MYC340]
MAFVVSTRSVPSIHGSAVRQASRRVVGRLRHLGAPSELGPQRRADRYVAHMPTAVLGAC